MLGSDFSIGAGEGGGAAERSGEGAGSAVWTASEGVALVADFLAGARFLAAGLAVVSTGGSALVSRVAARFLAGRFFGAADSSEAVVSSGNMDNLRCFGEAGREVADLGGEEVGRAVVEKNNVGAPGFFDQGHLRGEASFGVLDVQAPQGQPFQLDRLGCP